MDGVETGAWVAETGDMKARVAIGVHGPFRMFAANGTRIELASRKGMALIAMLVLLPRQEHNRDWLRRQLWGSRDEEQGQASLRKELSRLRKELEGVAPGLLRAEGRRVWLDPAQYDLLPAEPGQSLLEGLDIAGAPQFDAWLAQQRSETPHRPQNFGAPRQAAGLAVLPFVNESGDAQSDYLAAGIGDELADRISRLRWIKVIGSGSSFAVGGGEDVLSAGRRLGAAYVFGGRLRRGLSGWQLSGRLLACGDGEIICSPTLELRNPQESNAILPIVDQMVALLAERLDDSEQERVAALPLDRLDVNDLIWRGRWHQNRLSLPELDKARDYFGKAVQLAPESANAAIEWAQNFGYRLWSRRAGDGEVEAFGEAARRAVDLDRRDGRAHMLVGISEMWLRRMGPAETWFREAIKLCPSLAMAHEQMGTLQTLNSRPVAAAEWLDAALTLSPHDFRRFYREAELALALLLQGHWAEALDHAETAITLQPAYWHAHVSRINAYWRLGDDAAAATAIQQLQAARPSFGSGHIDWIPFRNPDLNAWLKEPLLALQPG
jgi:TolB-like protein/Tfp pilus assembly protein PilF